MRAAFVGWLGFFLVEMVQLCTWIARGTGVTLFVCLNLISIYWENVLLLARILPLSFFIGLWFDDGRKISLRKHSSQYTHLLTL